MPPIHPVVIHFPIALLVLSVAADFFGYIFQSASLQNTGWWSLVGAAIGAAVAVAAGLYDMNREEIKPEAHSQVHKHMKVGYVVLAVIAGLTIWRWLIYANNDFALNWLYLILAILILGLTLFQGWLGGELVFAYGVGVAPTGQGTETAEKSQKLVEEVVGGGEEEEKKENKKHH